MKKKIFLMAALCLCILGLTACSKTDPATVDYNGYSYEDLQSACQGTVQTLASMTEEDKAYFNANASEVIINLIDKWDQATAEYGTFVDFGEFEVTKSGKTLTAAQTIELEERPIILTYVYTYRNMEVEDITLDAVFTLGEKMSKAGLNTVMGITIVFTVLVLISLIISCFNIFPYLEKKKAEKLKAETPAADAVVTQIETREEQQEADDGELVAVIAAAIAAAEGTSTDGFVVRSIKRR